VVADARIIWRMLRGAARGPTHAERLQRFYAPQAEGYDAFRERLLHGRRELIERLPAGAGSRVVELGCGTARTLEFFGERLATFTAVEAVDLCPALLAVARRRARDWRNVVLIEADVTRYRPPDVVDCVYFSYALTMIPEWRRAIDNAVAMLKPGGVLGAVDFHLPAGGVGNGVWRTWFRHDGVRLSAEHLPYLRRRLQALACEQRRGAVPYLPGVRVPYYLFVGRRA
jgi:S-adenosylmethionine-diacylgycerolhomoserine-N-methlytransferase